MNSKSHSKLARRSFVGGIVGTAAVIATAPVENALLYANDDNPKGWIDAHVHVWHPDTKKYPLGSSFSTTDMQPPSFTADQLFSHCRPSNVKRIVLIQMNFYEYDHKYMLEAMTTHPGTFSGVALIDYRSTDVIAKVDELGKKGMRGFRIHSQGDAQDWVTAPGMQTLWKRAGELGLAVCPLINPEDIQYVDAMCEKYPDTTVIVDHFARIGVSGNIDSKHLDALCLISRFPKTYVKTSAFYALGKKKAPYLDLVPMIKKVYEHFGAERLMWASDCPFQVEGGHNYEDSIALIRDRIDFLSDQDKQWILSGTAEKLFFS